jgi:uncharacterized membrane protein (DUF485 family)
MCGVALGVGAQATPWLATSYLGVAVTTVEIVLAITVILTALFGSERYSSRAFRLLPWVARETVGTMRTQESKSAGHP